MANGIFLHGIQQDKFVPKEKGDKIEKRLEGICHIDSISYSDGLPTDKSLAFYVKKLEKIIPELGLETINVLIGHSYGGIVGCGFAKKFYKDYEIKMVIMLETPLDGVPGWMLPIWQKLFQPRASLSWPSIQGMKRGSKPLIDLNKDWPESVARFQIGGKLSVTPLVRSAFRVPKGVPVKLFPKVDHDGPTGLRTDPEVLDCIAEIYIAEILRSNS